MNGGVAEPAKTRNELHRVCRGGSPAACRPAAMLRHGLGGRSARRNGGVPLMFCAPVEDQQETASFAQLWRRAAVMVVSTRSYRRCGEVACGAVVGAAQASTLQIGGRMPGPARGWDSSWWHHRPAPACQSRPVCFFRRSTWPATASTAQPGCRRPARRRMSSRRVCIQSGSSSW